MINIENSKLTKKLFLYVKLLCNENWSNEINYLRNNVNLSSSFENYSEVNVENVRNKISTKYKNEWKLA